MKHRLNEEWKCEYTSLDRLAIASMFVFAGILFGLVYAWATH